MIIKYKRIGATITGFTQDNVYLVLGVGSDVRLLSDGNIIRGQQQNDINDPSLWELVSIETAGTVQLYP